MAPLRATHACALLLAAAACGKHETTPPATGNTPESVTLSEAGRAHADAAPLAHYGAVPAFTLTSEARRTVAARDLRDAVWVADFIFTSCAGVCPVLTRRMAELQRWAEAEHLSPSVLRLVSFSVDPQRDTPERLADFGKKHGADPARWSFLVGDSGAVEKAAIEGFKMGVYREKAAPGERADTDDGFTILHGSKLVLVDGAGDIRGYFDSDPDGLRAVEDAARRLLAQAASHAPLPAAPTAKTN